MLRSDELRVVVSGEEEPSPPKRQPAEVPQTIRQPPQGTGTARGRQLPEERRPFFYLSYARSRYRPEDSDRWVAKFFNDLCHDIGQATGTLNPGFMDRQIPVGSEWPDQLADALANCRVFVALFSPSYFTSEYCGKEWAAFLKRYHAHTAGLDRPPAIIPVWWTKMDISEIPEPLHSMQNVPPEFPSAYALEGIYRIMKLGRFREQYKETILRLATVIKDRAAACDLDSAPIPRLSTLRSPFSETSTGSRRPPIRLILAAQTIDGLRPERDAYYYGRTTREWLPFRGEDHTLPIGTFAERVLSELGHQVLIETIDEPPREPIDGPRVLVVDPWAVKDKDIGELLRQIDRDAVHLLAPFNEEDPQTSEAADSLSEDLREALPIGTALAGSAARVTSLDAFRDALATAVNDALSRYLRSTEEPSVGKPPSHAPSNYEAPKR
ncbi:TIR-like protein FxsC [Actinomadura sp. 1N219]|uniref:TIR-like protein FxsC n=1 Tax=Actinomadura sp. 1N219 TaxID=3375152 RepID=UPI0037B6B49C